MSNMPALADILAEQASNNGTEVAEPPIPSENYRSTTTSSPDLTFADEPEVSTGDSIGATTADTDEKTTAELFTLPTSTADTTVTNAVKAKALPVDETEKEDFCKTECPAIVGEPCPEVATEPEPCPTAAPCEICVTCAPEVVTTEPVPCPVVECPTMPPPTNTTAAPQSEEVDTKFALSISTTRAFYAGTDDLVFLNLVGENGETGFFKLETKINELESGQTNDYTVTQKFTGTTVDHVTIFKAGGDRWQVAEIKVTAGEGEAATFDCKDTKMEFSSPMLTCNKA